MDNPMMTRKDYIRNLDERLAVYRIALGFACRTGA